MLRIWEGPELEGSKQGIQTLFVESNTLIDEQVVIKFFNPTLKRVYLGAGRVEFIGFLNNLKFIEYCKSNCIEIVIETTIENLTNLVDFYDNSDIIISVRKDVDLPFDKINKLSFKFDTYKLVTVFSMSNKNLTDLSNLNDGLFSCDKLLLKEN